MPSSSSLASSGLDVATNAAYAADGYARIRGIAAVSTTYGVGELSAIAAIGGAYAEHLPVFHLVGMPNMPTQAARALVHHTLGNGEFDFFRKMTEPVVCASAIMTPQNVAYEIERLIAEALYRRRPVYMAFPADLANQPVVSTANPLDPPSSDVTSLKAATDAIVGAIEKARTACILPGLLARQVAEKSCCNRSLTHRVCRSPRCPRISRFSISHSLPTSECMTAGSWMKHCANSWNPVTWWFVSEP
jgi:TPP-dependent 2-oxoacid decarboxylase